MHQRLDIRQPLLVRGTVVAPPGFPVEWGRVREHPGHGRVERYSGERRGLIRFGERTDEDREPRIENRVSSAETTGVPLHRPPPPVLLDLVQPRDPPRFIRWSAHHRLALRVPLTCLMPAEDVEEMMEIQPELTRLDSKDLSLGRSRRRGQQPARSWQSQRQQSARFQPEPVPQARVRQ
jgi:hypothetical protein